jgi:isoamylase
MGSFDLYKTGGRPVGQSINFVTCHDGFTLNDLVSFNSKHNGANDELNRDGTDSNLSWNCGVEGLDAAAETDLLRTRQIKNFFALTLLSVGTPMLLMGDEVRRTQDGNNNAYCQDNETSWFDWNLCAVNSELVRFVQRMIRLRLHFDEGLKGGRITLEEYLSRARIEWHGVELGKPDWSADSHSIAFSLHSLVSSKIRYILMNAYWKPLRFQLPPVANGGNAGWVRLVDTSLPSPDDIAEMNMGTSVTTADYLVNPRSIVVLHHDYAVSGAG